jgi:hypothetical protein
MPTLGPVIQAPDYTSDGLPVGASPSTGFYSLTLPGTNNHEPQTTAGQAQAAQESANTTANHSGFGLFNLAGGGSRQFRTDYRGGLIGPWSTVIEAKETFSPRAISVYNASGRLWTPGAFPSGVIGWVWAEDGSAGVPGEGRPAQVVQCVLTITLTNTRAEDTSAGDPGIVLTDWSTGVYAAGTTYTSDTDPNVTYGNDLPDGWAGPTTGELIHTFNPGDETAPNEHEIDITSVLDAEGRTLYYFRVMPIGDPVTGTPKVILPADLDADQSPLAFGFGRTETVTWTLRPPPYQWVYADSEEPAPVIEAVTRLHPRDDGRGMSSAPRLYPPTKADRLVGGYQ